MGQVIDASNAFRNPQSIDFNAYSFQLVGNRYTIYTINGHRLCSVDTREDASRITDELNGLVHAAEEYGQFVENLYTLS